MVGFVRLLAPFYLARELVSPGQGYLIGKRGHQHRRARSEGRSDRQLEVMAPYRRHRFWLVANFKRRLPPPGGCGRSLRLGDSSPRCIFSGHSRELMFGCGMHHVASDFGLALPGKHLSVPSNIQPVLDCGDRALQGLRETGRGTFRSTISMSCHRRRPSDFVRLGLYAHEED
jgi:hypothetical protein